jgi:hypothetical protein
MFRDRMLAQLSLHPAPRPHRHHEKRMVRKPRHRYEQPVMIFHPHMDIKTHRTHTRSMLRTRNKLNIYFFLFIKPALGAHPHRTKLLLLRC